MARPRGIDHDTAIVLKRVGELDRPFSNADYQFYSPHRSILTIQTLDRRGYIRPVGRGRYVVTSDGHFFIEHTLGSRSANPVAEIWRSYSG